MKNISSMAALAALLLVSCGQDTDVKFAGDEGAKVTFSASINEQNSQDVSRVTGVTWDDGDEVSISCGPTQKNVFYRYNAADNSFTAINRFDEIWLLGNEEYDVTAYYPHVGEEGTVPPVQIVEITSENQDTPEERAAFDFLYASTKATKAEPNVHLTTADGRRIYYFLEIPVSDWPEMKAGYSYNYTLTANDYMTASPTVLEISGTDINPWTEVNKEETPDAKALGTEAKAEGSEWGEMETEEIIPVEKQ